MYNTARMFSHNRNIAPENRKDAVLGGVFDKMISEYLSTCAELEKRVAALDSFIPSASPSEAEAYACRRMLLRSEIWDMLLAVREMKEHVGLKG